MSTEKKWGILCYFPVANVVFCMVASVRLSGDKFVQFHVRQGMVLFGIWVITNFVAVIFPLLSLILWVILLLLYGAGMAIAYGGQVTMIPFVGQIAMKIPEDYFMRKLTNGKSPQPSVGTEDLKEKPPVPPQSKK